MQKDENGRKRDFADEANDSNWDCSEKNLLLHGNEYNSVLWVCISVVSETDRHQSTKQTNEFLERRARTLITQSRHRWCCFDWMVAMTMGFGGRRLSSSQHLWWSGTPEKRIKVGGLYMRAHSTTTSNVLNAGKCFSFRCFFFVALSFFLFSRIFFFFFVRFIFLCTFVPVCLPFKICIVAFANHAIYMNECTHVR